VDLDRDETARIKRQTIAADHTIEFVLAPQGMGETAQARRDSEDHIMALDLPRESTPRVETGQHEHALEAGDATLKFDLAWEAEQGEQLGETPLPTLEPGGDFTQEVPTGEDGGATLGQWPNTVAAGNSPVFTLDLAETSHQQGPQMPTERGTDDEQLTSSTVPLDDEALTGLAAVQTKLDLAKVYIELGILEDTDSLLQEVKDQGDDAQRQQAQELLRKIA
jgi:pilus assembly protein FimV